MLILEVMVVLNVMFWILMLVVALVMDTQVKYKLKRKNLVYYKWTTLSNENLENIEIIGIDTQATIKRMFKNMAKLLE